MVYITNRSDTHSYDSATRVGALSFVTTGNYPVFKTNRLQEEIITALAHSTKDDYLLFSGSGVICALCLAVWLEMHSTAKVLLWDRTQNMYVTRIIERRELITSIEVEQDLITGRMVR